ncbi:hypothetical protein I6E38_01585 [Prevotella stercorea]|uniref:hypothetical protein n=3 Tax=Prevotellaceae TaxID=171552 RepID=UPI001F3080C1|nr:hypothetical protein [Leyella stercorea]MCF2577814.1 hypothetical protein [Leyella stercorea]
MLTSCSDDQAFTVPKVSPDINVPITGYWQIAGEDINGDGAIQGIVVHNDNTVTEWMYTSVTDNPYKLGYKTGKWSVNGNHYEMQLPKDYDKYYNVTVAGNDDQKMYLAYNGKTSVVPFYRLTSLPGDGDKMISELEGMKMSGFNMTDFTGYWEQDNETGCGFYVDEEGNISDISQIWSGTYHHTVQYHSAKVELDDDNCTILSSGTNWNVYAVGNNSLLAFANGDNNNSVEHFVKKDVPEEMLRADEIMKKPVPEYILGKWVTTHYTYIVDGNCITDMDTQNDDSWNSLFYHTLAFMDNHKTYKWDRFGTVVLDQWFTMDGENITKSGDINALIIPECFYTETWTVSDKTEDKMKLTCKQCNTTEIYTYKRK